MAGAVSAVSVSANEVSASGEKDLGVCAFCTSLTGASSKQHKAGDEQLSSSKPDHSEASSGQQWRAPLLCPKAGLTASRARMRRLLILFMTNAYTIPLGGIQP